MGKRTSLPLTLDDLRCHSFQRSEAGIARVVKQHRYIFVELLRIVEADVNMVDDISFSQLDPGNAADHVGPKLHGLVQQLSGSRLAHDPILRKGDHLYVNDVAKLISNSNERSHGLQARFAVHVRKGTD